MILWQNYNMVKMADKTQINLNQTRQQYFLIKDIITSNSNTWIVSLLHTLDEVIQLLWNYSPFLIQLLKSFPILFEDVSHIKFLYIKIVYWIEAERM